ncbi:Uncharacterised protein [Streptococcus pneumoniae]|nr:Uncharacterised protein [Streptococcus pneumoniae]CKU66826.1 Uncharacterised protein [Mycobacterium tuberculosis]
MMTRKLNPSYTNVASATTLTFNQVASTFRKACLDHVVNLTRNNLKGICQLTPLQLHDTRLI